MTLEDVCEPYLLQIGFLARTLRGRMVTRMGYEHLGIPCPERRAAEAVDASGAPDEQIGMNFEEEE